MLELPFYCFITFYLYMLVSYVALVAKQAYDVVLLFLEVSHVTFLPRLKGVQCLSVLQVEYKEADLCVLVEA